MGEEIKNIDRKTEGKLLSRYPVVKWRGVMGVPDVLQWIRLFRHKKGSLKVDSFVKVEYSTSGAVA
jgi:hypothetical protein